MVPLLIHGLAATILNEGSPMKQLSKNKSKDDLFFKQPGNFSAIANVRMFVQRQCPSRCQNTVELA